MGFSERFPRWITGIIGLVLLLITAAIIGLEIGSCYIDLGHGTIWAGLWAGLIFLMTSLMMLFITCCCRGRYCAFYVLIMTIISGLLACVVIYFDQMFMSNLCKCYLGDQLCCAVRGIPSLQANYSSIFNQCGTAIAQGTSANLTCPTGPPTSKLILIQAQLGCAAGMIATCAVYVILFFFACCGVCFGHKQK